MKIKSSDILKFMETKGRELQQAVPGYCSLKVNITLLDEGRADASFSAYNEHLPGSPDFKNVDDAIGWISKKSKGQKESEMIIAKATELLNKAEKLVAEGR